MYVTSMLANLNLSRNDKSGMCELCNKKFDQRALEAMKIAYDDAEETDQATIKGFAFSIDLLLTSLKRHQTKRLATSI